VLSNPGDIGGAEAAARCQPVSQRNSEPPRRHADRLGRPAARRAAVDADNPKPRRATAGVITRVRVPGPTAPPCGTGPRRIAGCGPRDPYG
jgi:hypothetical protein